MKLSNFTISNQFVCVFTATVLSISLLLLCFAMFSLWNMERTASQNVQKLGEVLNASTERVESDMTRSLASVSEQTSSAMSALNNTEMQHLAEGIATNIQGYFNTALDSALAVASAIAGYKAATGDNEIDRAVVLRLLEGIQKTTGLISGIAVASNEQAQGVGQITTGLQQIDAVTQQNTASAEQSAGAANEMSEMARTLQDLVGRFKLKNKSH